MNRYTVIGISLPKTIVKKIDYVRGDINRSRWILRALERLMKTIEIKPQCPQVPAQDTEAAEIVPTPSTKEKAQP